MTDYEALFKMKQNDWIKVCCELDAEKAAHEKTRALLERALKMVEGLSCDSRFNTVYVHDNIDCRKCKIITEIRAAMKEGV